MAGGKRALRIVAAGLALVVALGGCAAGPDEPDDAGAEAAATTAEPEATPAPEKEGEKKGEPKAEGPAKVLIRKAFRKMQVAFKRKDARSAVGGMAPLSVRYLKMTQRAVATAGRSEIEKLSVWQKLVLTTLRTDEDPEVIGALSPEAFLDYVFDYDFDYFPTARLRASSIKMTSRKTAAVGIGSTVVWFQRVDGEWKVDCRGAFEAVSVITKRYAKKEGLTIRTTIFGLAEDFTTNVVPGDVWSKP